MKKIKLFGLYEFDGKEENLLFVFRFRNWTKKQINALNSSILKYFVLNRKIYNTGPKGCIKIKPIFKRINSISSVNVESIDVEKVASYLPNNLAVIFLALKPVLDRF
ncbi:MAG: hypothetical protein WC306_00720 [Candidatus Paceibacterota bacterium]|jgi:hypothetical protein